MKHLSLNRLIREVELNNDRRLTIAQKLDLMRCIQIIKRCRRLRRQQYEALVDYFTRPPDSRDLTVHEQWQKTMTILAQGLHDRHGTVARLMNARVLTVKN